MQTYGSTPPRIGKVRGEKLKDDKRKKPKGIIGKRRGYKK